MVITSICFAIIFRTMVSFLHYEFLSKRIAYASKQELLFSLFGDILLYKIDYSDLLSDPFIWRNHLANNLKNYDVKIFLQCTSLYNITIANTITGIKCNLLHFEKILSLQRIYFFTKNPSPYWPCQRCNEFFRVSFLMLYLNIEELVWFWLTITLVTLLWRHTKHNQV